ncbi:MAG: cellulase family glycosylhydrolase [Candidatus Hydrogenedentota bacterium]
MKIGRCVAICMVGILTAWTGAASLEPISLSEDGSEFVEKESGERFFAWGFNYDHDHEGRLIEDYWHDEWDKVAEDFESMKELGANLVRVHLQFGQFMPEPGELDQDNLDQLARLVALAEDLGLYLNLTGLACYHKEDAPAWYGALDEAERWETQAAWWKAVAEVAAGSPAVFCYDLMNEPILTGGDDPDAWLPGEGLDGKHFVQRITRDLGERTRQEVARAWVDALTEAIRERDEETLITVGVIPWVFTFGGGSPLFHAEEVGENLDFASVHFYPERGEVDKAVSALEAYDVGKPLVVEETFPLRCDIDELAEFIERSMPILDGVTGFFWGKTIEDLEAMDRGIGEEMTLGWLRYFRDAAPAE